MWIKTLFTFVRARCFSFAYLCVFTLPSDFLISQVTQGSQLPYQTEDWDLGVVPIGFSYIAIAIPVCYPQLFSIIFSRKEEGWL